MSKDLCGTRDRLRTCSKGPKTRHKCGERHMRNGPMFTHSIHRCKHCGIPFVPNQLPHVKAPVSA